MAAQKEARDDQAQPSIASLVRPNIRALKPYRCARDDYTEGVLLDANENPFGACLALEVPQMGAAVVDVEDATRSNKAHLDAAQSHLDLALHRYPDPYQVQLKTAIARHRHLPAGRAGVDRLFTGVGSDEAIDLLMRVFCRPGGVDSVLVCSPTYGMYRVSAAVNDINVVDVPLREDFHINVEAILSEMDEYSRAHAQTDGRVKLVFLCSPGNPTGTALRRADMHQLIRDPRFQAIMVVDEAYVDFVDDDAVAGELATAGVGTMMPAVTAFGNVVVLQTLSKSFGLAGIRMGIAASSPEIIHYMNAVKPPYNVSTPTAYFAYQAFTPASLTRMHAVVEQLKQERARLLAFFASHQTVERIRGGVDANFLLVQLHRPDSMGATKSPFTTRNAFAEALYKALAEDASENVVVRYRGNEPQCEGCLRVSVGTLAENDVLMRKWDEHARRMLA